MITFATAIIKGGSGKTTTAAALAQAAAADGKRVLAIDIDPQANLTKILGADPDRAGTYEFLQGDPDAIQNTAQGISVLAGAADLATIKDGGGAARRLRDHLAPLGRKFDFCFIDTPPTMGPLTYNALFAADGLIVPMETDSANIEGLQLIAGLADEFKTANPDLTIDAVILTRYDGRPKINRAIRTATEEEANKLDAIFRVIQIGIAIREAQLFRRSIYDYAPRSKPAEDYLELYKAIKRRYRKK